MINDNLHDLIGQFEAQLITEQEFNKRLALLDLEGIESIDIEYDADNDHTWVDVVYY